MRYQAALRPDELIIPHVDRGSGIGDRGSGIRFVPLALTAPPERPLMLVGHDQRLPGTRVSGDGRVADGERRAGAELAVVSRRELGGRRRRHAARQLGCRRQSQHPLEDRHSGAGALEPDRLGRSRLCHDHRGVERHADGDDRRQQQVGHRRGRRHGQPRVARDGDRQEHRTRGVGPRGLQGHAAREASREGESRLGDTSDQRPHHRRDARIRRAVRLRHDRRAEVADGSRARSPSGLPTIRPTSGVPPARR